MNFVFFHEKSRALLEKIHCNNNVATRVGNKRHMNLKRETVCELSMHMYAIDSQLALLMIRERKISTYSYLFYIF